MPWHNTCFHNLELFRHTYQGHAGYFREPHWKPMGLSETRNIQGNLTGMWRMSVKNSGINVFDAMGCMLLESRNCIWSIWLSPTSSSFQQNTNNVMQHTWMTIQKLGQPRHWCICWWSADKPEAHRVGNHRMVVCKWESGSKTSHGEYEVKRYSPQLYFIFVLIHLALKLWL